MVEVMVENEDSSGEDGIREEGSDEVRELPKKSGNEDRKIDSLLNSSEVHSMDEPSIIKRIGTSEGKSERPSLPPPQAHFLSLPK
jgi:hypothetical protein